MESFSSGPQETGGHCLLINFMKIGQHVQIIGPLRDQVGEPASGVIKEIDYARGRVRVLMNWQKINCTLWFEFYEIKNTTLIQFWMLLTFVFLLTWIIVCLMTILGQ